MCSHSTEDGRWWENIISRFDARASHVMRIIMSTATNEIIDPRDETMFQVVYESG